MLVRMRNEEMKTYLGLCFASCWFNFKLFASYTNVSQRHTSRDMFAEVEVLHQVFGAFWLRLYKALKFV
jgi:hypothetical protein